MLLSLAYKLYRSSRKFIKYIFIGYMNKILKSSLALCFYWFKVYHHPETNKQLNFLLFCFILFYFYDFKIQKQNYIIITLFPFFWTYLKTKLSWGLLFFIQKPFRWFRVLSWHTSSCRLLAQWGIYTKHSEVFWNFRLFPLTSDKSNSAIQYFIINFN